MHRPTHPRSRAWATASASALLVTSVLLLPGLAAAAPSSSVGAAVSGGFENSSWAAYPAGTVRIVFPSTLPQVYLVDSTNASMGAVLQVDALFELGPGGLPHPSIVAAAYPGQAARFNSTPPENLSLTPVGQSASLEVRSVNGVLWSSTGISTYPGPMIGATTLSMSYSILPAPATGVAVGWAVTGWPWISTSDLLALELHFSLTSASALTPCTGHSSPGPGPAACAGATVGGQGIAWDPTIQSVITREPGGDSASLAWSPTGTLPNGAGTPLVVGTFAPTNASAEIVLGAPAGGSTGLSGALQFSLFTPSFPVPPALLRGSAMPYLIALVVSAALSGIGVAIYRRREQRLRDEL